MTATITHWKNGAGYSGLTGSNARSAEVTNPATGEVTGRVLLASAEETQAIVASSVTAAETWAGQSIAKRIHVLFAFRELLNRRQGELADLITAEHGKVRSDALGEIARGLEAVEFACGLPHHLKGGYSAAASTGIDVHSLRAPLGVVAVISPFNFPAMIPMWFVPTAIAAGNAVVLKPSEKDPSSALWAAALWKEAGLPDGVLNVVQGDKVAVDALLQSPDIAAVSFVGSTSVAEYVYAEASRVGKRVQALGSAKNHMLVLPDADLDVAADAAVSAGFGSAGERCMAISVLVVVDPAGDELADKIAARMDRLVTGDGGPGHDREADMGPLVTRAHRDRVAEYVRQGEEAGAKLLVDGRLVKPRGVDGGFWLGPTLFDHVSADMTIYTAEIFGPVLCIVRVPTYEQGVALINGNPYGNGAAVFTRDGGSARRFENDVNVGMIGVNVPIPVPVSYYAFGGWKRSLFGDTHANGAEGVRFYTKEKVVTSRWADPASLAPAGVALGFPKND